MKKEPKFKYGEFVGFRSDSEFTASNKLLAPVRVIYSKWDKANKEYEYRLQNTISAYLEHELELR